MPVQSLMLCSAPKSILCLQIPGAQYRRAGAKMLTVPSAGMISRTHYDRRVRHQTLKRLAPGRHIEFVIVINRICCFNVENTRQSDPRPLWFMKVSGINRRVSCPFTIPRPNRPATFLSALSSIALSLQAFERNRHLHYGECRYIFRQGYPDRQ